MTIRRHIRHFLPGVLLACCSLHALAALPSVFQKTVDCKVIGINPFVEDLLADFQCEEGFLGKFHQTWMPNEAKIAMKRHESLEYAISNKIVSIKIHRTYQSEKDNHDYVVGTVYLDGKDIGLQLLKEGYAVTWPTRAWPMNPDYVAAQKQAQKRKAGLWGDPALAKAWSQTSDVTRKEMLDKQNEYRIKQIIRYSVPAMALLVLAHAFRRLRRIEFVFALLLVFVALPFYSVYAIPAFTFSGWVFPLLLLAAIAAMAAIPVLSFVVRSRFFKKNKTPDASLAEAPAVAVDG
ncbi:MAG: thermonuclease family protein [Burkholderiaceae bacterium]|jgi:hypothetical protein|nr:thermonuclease family protein [Burkholderiaceae bacterium]